MKEEDLLTRMSVYRKSVLSPGGGRFQPQDLKEDLRNLVEFYRSYGFAQVSITSTETVDPQRARVRSRLQIEEGPRYTVDFEGNHYFFDFRLRRDLVLFKSGNIGHTGLRRSAQNIRRRYLKAGFADVKVRWEEKNITVDEEPRVHVTMIIEEGPRHIVQSVEIRGNAHLDAKTLTAQMLTRPPMGISSGAYVADTLQEDLLAIQNLYRVTGFLNAHVKETVHIDPHSAATQVILAVDEGVQTRVGTISIDGQIPMDSATVLEGLQIKSGEPYTPANLKASENRLSAWISNLGYPHVRVQGRADISADQTRADVVYTVNSGPRVTVGQIFFLGNFRTQQRLMRRELDFDSGDPFLLQKVLEAQRDMRNLNIFDSVQVRTLGLKEQDKAVHLAVLALEKKPYYFEAAGGYQTDKGAYGRAKIGDHNFLGLGKDLSVSGEESQVGHRWEGNIADPRFLGTTIKSKAGVYTELSEPFNQDFGTTTAGANANLSYDWGQDFTNALSLRYERRQQYLRAAGSTAAEQDPEAFEPRTVSMLTPSIQYDSRDSFIQPRKGQLASLAVDISKGVENTLDDFLKYRVDLRHFHLLHPRVMLASHLWTGVIQPYNGDQPPQDQLFFLGGASTVRGFEENLLRYDEAGKAVGGRLALAASLETRISILNHFELIPFVDTGSVQDAVDDAGEDDFRWAMGLGLQYVTPIGPVGMFYGHKLDRRDGESSGQWHLSIGFTF
jgi:outer membrane protein insertion porin family